MRKILLATAATTLLATAALADTYPVTLRVTDGTGATTDQSFDITVAAGSGGATGWVTVPASTLPGSGTSVPAFRIMKYPARGTAPPASTPTGSPTIINTLGQARTACQSLGAGFDVPTLSQYLAVAHNALGQTVNWTGGVVGSGNFMSGTPGAAGVASSDDALGYTGISAVVGNDKYRRTWMLSNGGVIWDLSGSTGSYGSMGVVICDQPRPGCVSGTISNYTTFFGTSSAAAMEWTAMTTLPALNSDIKPLSYNSSSNVGTRAVGYSSDIIVGYGGVFGMYSIAYTGQSGFRCAGPAN